MVLQTGDALLIVDLAEMTPHRVLADHLAHP
jgi:hypothetical protein